MKAIYQLSNKKLCFKIKSINKRAIPIRKTKKKFFLLEIKNNIVVVISVIEVTSKVNKPQSYKKAVNNPIYS